MPFTKRTSFYHHIPEEYYHQGCALCEKSLGEKSLAPSDREVMLLTAEVSDLPNIVARNQTTATVSAMLESRPVIGLAHITCIVANRWAQRALITDFPLLKEALPYYEYVAQLFAFDSVDRYVCIESEQRQILLHTRDRWERYQSAFPNVDPPTWIHCTLIAAIAITRISIPLWYIRIPGRPNMCEYINDVKRCMQKSQTWDDSMAVAKLSGSVYAVPEYPIIDYTRIK